MKINEIVEAEFLFDYLMFGKDFENYKDDDLIYQRNSNLKNKHFYVETSLKLLNPQLYNNDANSIKDILYNHYYLLKQFTNFPLFIFLFNKYQLSANWAIIYIFI